MTRLYAEPVMERAGWRIMVVCILKTGGMRHGRHVFCSGEKRPVAVIMSRRAETRAFDASGRPIKDAAALLRRAQSA